MKLSNASFAFKIPQNFKPGEFIQNAELRFSLEESNAFSKIGIQLIRGRMVVRARGRKQKDKTGKSENVETTIVDDATQFKHAKQWIHFDVHRHVRRIRKAQLTTKKLGMRRNASTLSTRCEIFF